MIRSMTGFGRAAFEAGGVAFQVEVRSVNHRHLDLQLRLPRVLQAFEAEARGRLQGRFARGKIEVSVQARGGLGPTPILEIDREAARHYVEAARALAAEHGIPEALDASDLLALPGVARLVEHEIPEEALRGALEAALDEAVRGLTSMREAEGASLERELRGRLARVVDLLDDLAARVGEVQLAARERLRKRADQLARETGLADEARLHQEIVLAADRLDVTEEIVRLRSHVDQFRAALDEPAGEPVGRRLDFLLQEMVREANTVGSKGSDAPVAHRVVDLKTEVERLREQTQNVE